MSTSTSRDTSRTAAGAHAEPGDSAPQRVAQQASKDADSTYDPSLDATRDVVINALEDMKARDVQELDVRAQSDVTDLLVIASGTSSRHVRSIAGEVVSQGKQAGRSPVGVEGEQQGEWVLVDLGEVVVHVMQPRTREVYGLERLWDVAAQQSDGSLFAG